MCVATGPEGCATGHTLGERVDHLPYIVIEDRQLPFGRAVESNTPGETVHHQTFSAYDLGQSSARHPHRQLYLEGPVLPLAEAQAVPCVLVALRFDVWNGVPVTPNEDGALDSGHFEGVAGDWKPLPQQEAKK